VLDPGPTAGRHHGLVNGENVRLKNYLETRVRAGDTVDLFAPAGGG
jgi:molybdopterin converting factor small subunit